MSYQVLARKWRPQTFADLVGQSHVKTALTNAIDLGRLHHAYLFTGTRGVGKTTIARLFSKSLNCDQGVTSQPCGQCSECVDIEQGRFVDLIEIDAASRTKVEDTREILENVQYAPTRGRFKVYLIDEVHMLSRHSFNALLKTLEEPPEHVKFLLATTDPQKLPVTVLSRCLQFNLKALNVIEISQQLANILEKENISVSEEALKLLAKYGHGSLRDALSLTDQAIAHANGPIDASHVHAMLGTLDKNWAMRLLQSVVTGDKSAFLATWEQVCDFAPNYTLLLEDMLGILHLTALVQVFPEAAGLEDDWQQGVQQLAQQASPEKVQMLYQMAAQGKKELALIDDGQMALHMILLRMLAFEISPFMPATGTATARVQPEPSIQAPQQSQPYQRPEAPSTMETLQADQDAILQQAERMASKGEVAQGEALSDVEQTETLQAPLSDPQVDVNPENEIVSLDDIAVATADDDPVMAILNQRKSGAVLRSVVTGHAPSKVELEQAPVVPEAETPQPESRPVRPKTPPVQETPSLPRIMHPPMQDEIVQDEIECDESNDDEPTSDEVVKPQQDPGHNVPDPPVSDNFEQEAVPHQPEKIEGTIESTASDAAPALTELSITLAPFPTQKNWERPCDSFVHTDILSAAQVDAWSAMIKRMALKARVRQMALHARFVYQPEEKKGTLYLEKAFAHLDTQSTREQLEQHIRDELKSDIAVFIEFEASITDTPYKIQQEIHAARQERAVHAVSSDPFVISLQEEFAAEVEGDTITPIDH